ncbi:hypothetical protein AKJ37_01500 [candidate division MSBL1 archaeon SCGC-AAA259I09]|uniref:Uncharacterized protein n=1 Tax=candidate division MSBL1 archaeon SCGC-AAA259I09 TaxID=1698267 RepID=A0A133UV66_9EURY|nr:hypothetical protein AKJ37_01500 [candidate division MSBL1 archaeon SCGC-AAA259I09]
MKWLQDDFWSKPSNFLLSFSGINLIHQEIFQKLRVFFFESFSVYSSNRVAEGIFLWEEFHIGASERCKPIKPNPKFHL